MKDQLKNIIKQDLLTTITKTIKEIETINKINVVCIQSSLVGIKNLDNYLNNDLSATVYTVKQNNNAFTTYENLVALIKASPKKIIYLRNWQIKPQIWNWLDLLASQVTNGKINDDDLNKTVVIIKNDNFKSNNREIWLKNTMRFFWIYYNALDWKAILNLKTQIRFEDLVADDFNLKQLDEDLKKVIIDDQQSTLMEQLMEAQGGFSKSLLKTFDQNGYDFKRISKNAYFYDNRNTVASNPTYNRIGILISPDTNDSEDRNLWIQLQKFRKYNVNKIVIIGIKGQIAKYAKGVYYLPFGLLCQ